MRILIDECIHEKFRHSFPGYDCQTARYAGFAGFKNGRLLDAAEAAQFEVLLTVDRGLEYQHNFARRRIAVVIFVAKSIRLTDLLPFVPRCLTLLPELKAGDIVKISNL